MIKEYLHCGSLPKSGKKGNILLGHTTYKNDNALPWVTFIDGAGGVFSTWNKQLPEFKLLYNILVIELREIDTNSNSLVNLDFDTVSKSILYVLELNNIERTHIVGFSLGTIFVKYFALKYSRNVESVILSGAIAKINRRLRFLFWIQNMVKSVFSFSSQFRFFSYFLLPNKNHKETRLFIRSQSMNWDEEEFFKWAGFTKKLNPVLNYLYSEQTDVPSVFVMGEEDKLFLPEVKKMASHNPDSLLFIIQDCGHVVNMEQALLFNRMVIGYLTGFEVASKNNRAKIKVKEGLISMERDSWKNNPV
ncbi:alpha/beta fold hydrolase [Maribacter algicola]|uniref:Alpha/beta fold hydrolase n=1 Tax=Maribacter algicola TaxID=2498892 RepID=A0A3R8S0A1_9FLAO|nr:alpha/beta fold hydrolase [Maribacter algicola]